LTIIAGRAQTQPHLPLTTLADELAKARLGALDNADPAASVPAALLRSYKVLPDHAARAFTLLGLMPGPDITLAAAASLLALPPDQTRSVLRVLEHSSLLRQPVPGRYGMHDLVKHYASDRAAEDRSDTERVAAMRRTIEFYAHTAHTAQRLLCPMRPAIAMPGPAVGVTIDPLPSSACAADWCEAEHDNIVAVQRIAVAHGWHDLSWQLAWSLTTFRLRNGHPFADTGFRQLSRQQWGDTCLG
jgi:hypothetical protein